MILQVFYLAEMEFMFVEELPRSDMQKIAKATGGKIVSNLNDLTQFELGSAESVENVKRGE